MSVMPQVDSGVKPVHPWLRKMRMAFVPGPMTPLLEEVTGELLRHARLHGHILQTKPDDETDAILTTAPFRKPLSWRQALLPTGRLRYKLSHTPNVFTLVHAKPSEFQSLLDHFEAAVVKKPVDPADYDFPGLAPQAYHVLHEQGSRGGPILALERLVQAQSMCLRVILVVGDERPLYAYHFDLVGGHPRSQADDLALFYDDLILRMVTTLCTHEVTQHQVVGEPIAYTLWQSLDTPGAMRVAGHELGRRNFFTELVRIDDVVQVPAVGEVVASQYSEGCFSTWDRTLGALVATVTGSARPLSKDHVTEEDLAVIVGVRPDGEGALMQHVEGKENIPPSSESVEMMAMDRPLPTIQLGMAWDNPTQVPVVRSKLHGHRGIAAYHPDHVEFVRLPSPYYHYLVSCATDAQAIGIEQAFARSEALQDPDDPRQVVFTVLPGHGTLIVEKWVVGKAPFQVIWEYMDAGNLEVSKYIPQGPFEYLPGANGRLEFRVEK